MKWYKRPSVSPGGKVYFWHGRANEHHYWVVWDRQKRKWAVEIDGPRNQVITLGYFATVAQGKKFVEKGA